MFIDANRKQWPVRVRCTVLEVHPSGYYAWKPRPAKTSTEEERSLLLAMRQIYKESRRATGTRGMVKELKNLKHDVGRKRVRRLMNEDGMVAKRTPRFRSVATTNSDHDHPIAENLVNRDFSQAAPNMVWSCDITYIRTRRGFVYLAVVMDLYSRRIIGWHVAEHMTQRLTLLALWKALKTRGLPTGMIMHSDRGVKYAARGYRQFVENHCSGQQSTPPPEKETVGTTLRWNHSLQR